MDAAAEILIVARDDDSIGCRFREELGRRGRRVCLLDGPTASRLFTIRVAAQGTSVTPVIPMFLRPNAWFYEETSKNDDERFLRAEAFATFWAAAALSPARVVNRPQRNGLPGRMTWADLCAVNGWQGVDGTREMHASSPKMLGSEDDTVWGEDMMWLTAPVAQLRPNIPLRARKVNTAAEYEIVCVVGQRAFPATSDPRTAALHLEHQSVELARKANVIFASVTWAVDESGATAVRLNAAPDEHEVRYAWPEIAQALCEELLT